MLKGKKFDAFTLSGEKKTYERKQVVTGLSDGVNIEIKKGLSLKDRVRGPEIVADNKDDE